MLSNWEAPLSRGVLHPLRIARHFSVFDAILAGRRTIKDVSQDLLLRDSKHQFEIEKNLLNDEGVCIRTDIFLLGEFRKLFDVKLNFAQWRQDLWLESWYLQNIEWPWNKLLSHAGCLSWLHGLKSLTRPITTGC